MDAPGRCENGGQSHRPGNFINLISYEHIAANKFTFANKSAKVNCTLHLANHTAQHFRANIDVWEQASQPALDRPELANDHRARSSIIRSHAKHVEWGHQLVGHGCASRLVLSEPSLSNTLGFCSFRSQRGRHWHAILLGSANCATISAMPPTKQ